MQAGMQGVGRGCLDGDLEIAAMKRRARYGRPFRAIYSVPYKFSLLLLRDTADDAVDGGIGPGIVDEQPLSNSQTASQSASQPACQPESPGIFARHLP
jgi:hypothetical protein